MIFYFKKFISQFLMPFPLVVLLFMLGAVCIRFTCYKRIGRWMIGCAVLLVLLFGYGLGAESYLFRLERFYPTVELNDMGWESFKGCTIVVLGHGMPKESDIAIRYQTGTSFQMRLQEGMRLYRKIPDARMVVSIAGGASIKRKEEFLDDYAQEHGLKRSGIFLVPSARDTTEEARLSMELVKTNGCIVVTSATHIPRAIKIFAKEFERRSERCRIISSKEGVEHWNGEKACASLMPAPCDFLITAPSEFRFEMWALPFPSLDGFNLSQRAIYEFLGNLYEDITGGMM